MPTFDLGLSQDPNNESMATFAPAWVIAVVPFKHIATYSRVNQASLSLDGSEVAAEDPLIIISDTCTQITVTKSKEAVVSSLVATLSAGERDYATDLKPGDWMMAWMCQSKDKITDIIKRLNAGQPCNNFDDGLKFVGRVWSCFEVEEADESGGRQKMTYALNGAGFSEFDSQVFWDAYLSVAVPNINTWLGEMGIGFDSFLADDGIDVNTAIPELLELLLGRGISQQAANPAGNSNGPSPAALAAGDNNPTITGLTQGQGEAPFAYVVPTTIGNLLGKKSRSKTSGVLAYSDILNSLYGIQKYQNQANGSNFQSTASQMFTQQGKSQALGTIFQPFQTLPMLGRFLPEVPQLSGKSVWSVLATYLNPTVNEMYTCLRVDTNGTIQPTLVVRQQPFTSNIAAAADRTSFLELPRWKLPPWLKLSHKRGRSNALRHNFVHMMGVAPSQAQPNIYTYQLVRSPPIRDDQDIRRSGLRADISQVNCDIQVQQQGPGAWMELRADWVMGQHLTFTGQFNLHGLQDPICEGDNLEYGGLVYHIETVTHTGLQDEETGKRRFMTALQVSHGMRADDTLSNTDPDMKLYGSVYSTDLPTDRPGISYEGNDTGTPAPPNTTGAGDFPPGDNSAGGLA